MHHLLYDISVAITVALLFGLIAFWLKQPVILGYLVAGIVAGPQMGLALIYDVESIQVISEIGLVLLLFIIGLEMNVKELMGSGKQLILAGFGQFPLSAAIGVAIFAFAGYGLTSGNLAALYLAIACGISSTAIVVKILYDKRELDTTPGRLTLGVLIFQDIFAILVLGLQENLSNPQIGPLLHAIGATIALLLFAYLASRFLLSKIFVSISHTPELILTASIGWCAAMAMMAQGLGVSKEMGALVGGIAVASFPYSMHITAKTLPIRDFFITLFFVSLGMQIPALQSSWIPGIALCCLVVYLSRFLSVYPLVLMGGGGRRAAFISSINLAQISEFSLVIASLGLGFKHINQETLATITYAMALLAVVSSYTIRWNHTLYSVFDKIVERFVSQAERFNAELAEPDASHDIVLLGCHRTGMALVDTVMNADHAIRDRLLVVDFNPVTLKALRDRGIYAQFGDIGSLDTLEHAHVKHARFMISTIPDMLLKGVNNATLVRFSKSLAPSAKVVATANDPKHAEELKAAGADWVINPFDESANSLLGLLKSISAVS